MQEGDGDEDRHQHQAGGHDGEAHLAGAAIGRHQARLALLGQAAVNVFQDHDGIVHHQADSQHQGQEGENVDGKAQHPDGQEGGDERHGHHHRRHQGGAPTAQEKEDDQHHQEDGLPQGFVNRADGTADEHRGIEALMELHALGQGLVKAAHLRLGRLGDGQGVGGGLLDDADAHHGQTIAAEGDAVLVRAQFHPGDIPQAHQGSILAPGEGQTGEILGGLKSALGADAELALAGFHAPRRQFQILGAQGILHLVHRQAPGRQGLAVEPDAHGKGLAAADPHPRHAIDHRKTIHQVAAGIVAQFRDRQAVAGQVEPEDDVLVGVHLLDLRRLRLVRQVIADP